MKIIGLKSGDAAIEIPKGKRILVLGTPQKGEPSTVGSLELVADQSVTHSLEFSVTEIKEYDSDMERQAFFSGRAPVMLQQIIEKANELGVGTLCFRKVPSSERTLRKNASVAAYGIFTDAIIAGWE